MAWRAPGRDGLDRESSGGSITARAQAAGTASSSTLESETTAQGGKFIAVKEINGEECCQCVAAVAG